MLMDITGVLLGFITVILLLSLLVTGVTQGLVAAFGVKKNNLLLGLEWTLEQTRALKSRGTEKKTGEVTGESHDLAQQMLSFRQLARARRPKKVPEKPVAAIRPNRTKREMAGAMFTSVWHGIAEGFRRPRSQFTNWVGTLSWVDQDHLDELLELTGVDVDVKDFKKAFFFASQLMEKRYTAIARLITIFGALVVAYAFQVSAPHLLGDLWQDSAKRERYAAMGMDVAAAGESAYLLEVEDFGKAPLAALSDLSLKYPDYAGVFEEVNAEGGTETEILVGLQAALEGHEHADEIVQAYREGVQDRLATAEKRGWDAADAATTKLTALEITPWRFGTDYYIDQDSSGVSWWSRIEFAHIFGVLATALLLTFGAPFWFDQLKNVAKLREAVQGGSKPAGNGKGQNGQEPSNVKK